MKKAVNTSPQWIHSHGSNPQHRAARLIHAQHHGSLVQSTFCVWNVIMITVSYTLHNFLAAVLTMIHGSAHLYQTQRLGNMCCTPCIQTQYAQRKVLNCYDSIHYPWFTCLSLRRWIRSWITVWFYRETNLYYPELLSRSIQTPFTANGKFGIPILFNTVLLFSGKKWL